MKKQDQTYDVIVIGAGPSGQAFAKAISGCGLSIAVIDPSSAERLASPAYDGRETALTHFTYDVLNQLEIWDELPADAVSYIKNAHVINGDSDYALKFSHLEAGADTLGYMVSNQNICKATYKVLKRADDVTWLLGRKVSAIETRDTGATITLDNGDMLAARLVVAADGRFSATRRMMAVKTDVVDWGRTCLVGTMVIDGDHHDTAFECFHYDRTLAVLPLNNNRVSVVITLPSSQAQAVMDMSDEDFARDIEARFEGRVGSMKVDAPVQAYPLACTYANKFYARRYALLGDAAVGMHPVTAHGYNLGVRGAYALGQQVRLMAETGGDIGSSVVLANYNRVHQRICKPLYVGTNTLVKLYTDTRPPMKLARKALLHLGNVLKPANQLIMKQLTQKQ